MMDLLGRFSIILKRGRSSHAYILERGSEAGRINAALSLARLILCEDRERADSAPCGHCLPCRKIEEGIHPDVIVARPENNRIRLDTVRAIINGLKFPPLEGVVRVNIIYEAQKMNPDAANTILKTLEEPPPKNIFFLTTPRKDLLLSTIVSRCQILEMDETRCQVLGEKGDKGLSPFLLYLSGGDEEEARRLEAEGILDLRDKIFSLILHKSMGNAVSSALAKALALSKDVSRQTERFVLFLRCLQVISRDILVMSSTMKGGADDLVLNQDKKRELMKLCDLFDEITITEYQFWLSRIENRLRRGINLGYAATAAILFWFGVNGEDRNRKSKAL